MFRGVGGSFVLIGAGTCLGLFGLFSSSCGGFSSTSLTSVRAVDGALSIRSPPFSFSESSDFAESAEELLLLEWLRVLLAVLVRLITALPVWGGEARLGDTSVMLLRKSK